MIDMEMERVPYDVEFNDLYRKAMELICNNICSLYFYMLE